KVALAVAIEQSPFLKVFPDERVREPLRLMDRSPDEHVTRAIAREIAQREQLKALLAGSIAPLGRNYVVAVEAVNAQTGDVMARAQMEVPGKEQVLTGLGGSASPLRGEVARGATPRPKGRHPAAPGDDPVARGAARLCAGARRRTPQPAARSDPAPEARDRARSGVRDGAGAAVERLRQHEPDVAGAGAVAARVRLAGSGE